MPIRAAAALFGACFTLAGSGCSLLTPKGDPTDYYVLRSLHAQEETARVRDDSTLVLSVGPTIVPGYLDRTDLVTSANPYRIELDDLSSWGEGLDESITRVVAQDLSYLLGTEHVAVYPDITLTEYDYRVFLWVTRFERNDQGEVALDCSWIVGTEEHIGRKVNSGTSQIRVAMNGGPDRVFDTIDTMSRALMVLSREIAEGIDRTPLPTPIYDEDASTEAPPIPPLSDEP